MAIGIVIKFVKYIFSGIIAKIFSFQIIDEQAMPGTQGFGVVLHYASVSVSVKNEVPEQQMISLR